jgi:hypothetical protein
MRTPNIYLTALLSTISLTVSAADNESKILTDHFQTKYYSCDTSLTDHYKTKTFDCVIFSYQYLQCSEPNAFADTCNRTPNRSLIDSIEKKLDNQIKKYVATFDLKNKDNEGYLKIKTLSNYKRQYYYQKIDGLTYVQLHLVYITNDIRSNKDKSWTKKRKLIAGSTILIKINPRTLEVVEMLKWNGG